ncbi:MAG: GHMP kinase [Planctomycetales bacterium]
MISREGQNFKLVSLIAVRAPLRISFVGGGSDLPAFYTRHPGRVVSAAIDKYVYVVANHTPLIDKIAVRYSKTEIVNAPEELQHTRVRAALIDLGIRNNLEIATFASLPARTGLGSSSSFSVALMRALYALKGHNLTAEEAASEAVRLEIDLLQEPIGKQDQYAAAFGGLNVITFQPDGKVQVDPLMLDYKVESDLEHHMLVFYTGLTRDAGTILEEQNRNIGDDAKFRTMQKMVAQVEDFVACLKSGNLPGLGEILNAGWQMKRSLASSIPLATTDVLYEAALAAGAWGGKLLGAGGGGCLLFLAPIDRRDAVRDAMTKTAATMNLIDFKEVPVRFSQPGSEIQFRENHGFRTTN